ncbi:thiolase family protein [Haloferax mediterranei ATCC 33500]|uniref:3-ketoacyl-CoA thiolase n=1 Tax=Haloferax mediterranei (strain ATCC 33500 / DSM 1411 / JCM 8866 / NBRC 14739 / NCIMB 2177 / R-4) TaxID=523841 RepID=I3R3D1_HALMT|nr:3-ketoacyl-CoA thiolase [Haloferax mediterranei]AFK18741.1 PHA-specific beta-ketothiolase alpha subunit [Haloferax mediterranei ATCC 33500]AHZ21891.1 3-ketoacyl-CoA thiolase [Haloferax mediterranei ATCC 33500]EMA03399.1 acetyl-CoA C-acyltransferase [Haloferax mediterranei ATCC 33500]MDX5988837.1 thiolase family protein [Haloferax mediterranei ATCC 33500]QCQ75239.1 thiolase family protein [Haloferax mediterranei ATCC 33500]
MDRVAIIGASMTQFGQRDAWIRELLAEAGQAALADADVSPDEIEHLYVSNMASGEFEGQTGVPNALAHDLAAMPAYTARIDQTSSSGGAGVYAAWQSVASGASDMTMLVGGEKMTHRSTAEATDVIASLTHPVEYKHGVTLPSFAGLTARLYLDTYDAPRESLGKVAVKNHKNGLDNPHAQFRKEVDLETVLDSPVVADPLRLYDFCPITDGSAALVFCSESVAREYTDDYVVISGIGGATDTHVVHERADPTTMGGVVNSSDIAYEMADLEPDDIDVAELHDMFTILEFLQSEDLGFFEKGEGWKAVEEGVTDRDGELPINTSGGLKSKGHPLGASGVAQVYEIYKQLIGDAGDRQVDADIGLACNVGGFGNCVTTTIMESQ